MLNHEELLTQIESYFAKNDKSQILDDVKKNGALKYIQPIENSIVLHYVISPQNVEVYNPFRRTAKGLLRVNGITEKIVSQGLDLISVSREKDKNFKHLWKPVEIGTNQEIPGYEFKKKDRYVYPK